MKLYSIFFGENCLPVFEGKDGRYWLGGTSWLMSPLIFTSLKSAKIALEHVKTRINNEPEYSKSVLKTKELYIKKFEMVVIN